VKIHEYQGKEIFRKYGKADVARLPCIQRRRSGRCGEEARRRRVGGQGADPCRRSRQGEAELGSRSPSDEGKARLLDSSRHAAQDHQTGPQGQKVRRLLVEEGADIKQELYAGMGGRPRLA
jgi:succinyl-CoA synthetase beta subunit